MPTLAFMPGEIVVKFQSHVGPAGARNSLQAKGLQPLQVAVTNDLLRVKVAPGHEAEAIAELMARGDVEFATLNYRVYALGDPNDPYFSSQWALKQAQDYDIDAPEAWDLHTGSNSVTIAVIDTGIDLDHPDLQTNIVPGYNYISPGALPDDDHGHGSHVAGIAAAVGNNGIGIAGVSWQARLMPLKILDAFGNGSTYNLAQAIYYAADNGAKVINMSLGGSCGTGWPEVEAAVNYAVNKGVLLVAASGNNYSTPLLCPGAISGVMAVGATDSFDLHAAYSTYGVGLAVSAPGSSIYSTVNYGGYGYKSGTSMATPHVAGLTALIWSYAPSLSSSQVRDLIQNTANDLGTPGWDQYFGYGRINAHRALEVVTLWPAPSNPLLLVGDNQPTASTVVQIGTANPAPITWSAAISPTTSWLTLAPPAMGQVTAASTDQYVTLTTDKNNLPGSYNTYTANLVLTGTTSTGVAVGPITAPVRVEYVPEVKIYYFPLIFKN
jgi:subtilisin family serine protease